MGGFAFKDEQGASLASGIEQRFVLPTLEDLFQNHLEPAGVTAYEPVGSTGKKSLSGDLDIAVHLDGEDPKETKQKLLKSLMSTLDPATIKVSGTNLAVLYPIKGDPEGKKAQVDLMIATDLQGTSWLMSGSDDEGIKGMFRNSMLSHIAAHRSKEMAPHEKITVAIPGGLGVLQLDPSLDPDLLKNKRKFKLIDKRVTSPQEILKGLGINASPEEVATFDGLVSVMVKDPELKRMLPSFEDYLLQRKGITKEPQFQRVISYVEKSMNENVIRKIVRLMLEEESKALQVNKNNLRRSSRSILQEQDEESIEPEVESDIDSDNEPDYPAVFKSSGFNKKAEILLATFRDFGLPVEKIINAGSKEIRVGLQKGSNPEGLESSVELAYQKIFPGEDISVDIIPPGVLPNLSNMYNAYSVSGQPLIVFSYAGLSAGSRSKGYEYEEDMEKAFQADGASVYSDNDVSTSDIEINGVGIELKLPNAQAGEPFLTYSFETGKFTASNPKKVNNDIAGVINKTFKKADTKKKLDKVKAVMKLDANDLSRVPTEIFKKKVRPELEKLDNQYLASYEITSKDLRKYYKEKGADLIQIKGRGLYHLTSNDIVTFSDGRSTSLFNMEEPAKGYVTLRNAKTAYAMRPHLTNNPLKKLGASPITLDDAADRKLFVAWTEKKNLSESSQNRWQLIAGIKND